jgi:ABC-type cobalamin/Fe3+-siderophores transport system ATPase subunit
MEIIGTKWFKCDLHLHTPESRCFLDRDTVLPEQWVKEAIGKGLNCVAITDHNSGEYIDKIKDAAKETDLVVFPGVEVTCSDAKIHLLVLFDVDKGTQEVNDFLIKIGINRTEFGEQTAGTNKNLEDVVQIATECKALVIPAHVDEYNGISQAAFQIREDFLKLPLITGVQVVHETFLKKEADYNKATSSDILSEYYPSVVSEERQKDWRQTVIQCINYNKAILTFSDNPHQKGDSKHGLWGIGKRYTWIKLDVTPSLESLRQALLLHKFRVRNDFQIKGTQTPYELPNEWIEKILIKNTLISDIENPLEIQFSPQLNTIIGGRGSGKSSVLRFLRGAFPNLIAELDIDSLKSIKDDFNNFFSIHNKSKETGVLNNGSEIDVFINRNSEKFKVNCQILSNKPEVKVFKLDSTTGDFVEVEDEGMTNIFQIDIFSQKQIYDIGTKTNSLRQRIDSQVSEVNELNLKLNDISQSFKEKSSHIRRLKEKTSGIGQLKTVIKDAEAKIETFNKSGVKELIKSSKSFSGDKRIIDEYSEELNTVKSQIESVISDLDIAQINSDQIDEKYQSEILEIANTSKKQVEEFKSALSNLLTTYNKIKIDYDIAIANSLWHRDKIISEVAFTKKKVELEKDGIDDLNQIEKEIEQVNTKKKELDALEKEKESITSEEIALQLIKGEYILHRKQLTEKRREFLDGTLTNNNARAKVKPFRDFDFLEKRIKDILNIENQFEDDVSNLVTRWNTGDTERNNKKVNEIISSIREDNTESDFSSRFHTKIRGLNGEQLDEFSLLFPEDEIVIEYRKGESETFKSISNASPGQKSAAILTLLLSHGEGPLVLDQPEDDLDNYLIYDLIVEQLLHSKDNRQIIVVTHNANIPVNGDSEQIIIMDSESKLIKLKDSGTIENVIIKDEICKVMEGGTEAFEMRSKRYIRN